MEVAHKLYINEQDYLEMERKSPFKHEYYRGDIFAMSGASFVHNQINRNLNGILIPFLSGKSCSVFSNDLRTHIPNPPYFTYPDLVIICGKPDFLDNEFDTIKNPKVIIEILSPSTAKYDKEIKFGLYGFAESFEEYILVHQDEFKVENYLKIKDSWQQWETKGEESKLKISSINLEIPFKKIYQDVAFKKTIKKLSKKP